MVEKMEPEVASYRVIVLEGQETALNPYKNLIFSTFLNSLRYGNPWFEAIDSRSYYRTHQALLEKLLSRQGCTVRIAVLSSDPDVALGWSISRPHVLDYIFVKRDGRRQGIGRSLLPESFVSVSHLTTVGKSLKEKHFPDVKFDPFQ